MIQYWQHQSKFRTRLILWTTSRQVFYTLAIVFGWEPMEKPGHELNFVITWLNKDMTRWLFRFSSSFYFTFFSAPVATPKIHCHRPKLVVVNTACRIEVKWKSNQVLFLKKKWTNLGFSKTSPIRIFLKIRFVFTFHSKKSWKTDKRGMKGDCEGNLTGQRESELFFEMSSIMSPTVTWKFYCSNRSKFSLIFCWSGQTDNWKIHFKMLLSFQNSL